MRRRNLGIWLVALLPLIAGCWDWRGLEGRGFVVMAGIDRTGTGQYRIALQFPIARPEQVTMGGGAGGGGQVPPFRVITGEGDTIRQAFERARADVAREVEATVLDTIVIGERAAENLADLDWIARELRIPSASFVAVARGDAEPVVRAETPAFGVPAQYALQAFRGHWTRTPAVVRVFTWMMLHRDLQSPLADPYAPAMTSEKYGLNWDGMAVFRGPHLAGFLDEDAAALFNMVQGERTQSTVSAPVAGEPGARAALFVHRASAHQWVTWDGDWPVLHVQLKATGDLRELTGMALTDPAKQARVEASLAAGLAGDLRGLLQRLQQLQADPLGFGERARRAAPYHPRVRDREAWIEVYRQARIDVRTQVRVTSTGFRK